MRVLVTGGAGFIGSHTVEALLESDCEVVVLDNLSSGSPENLPGHPRLKLVEGDIRDRSAVSAAMKGCTHALNLAAQVSVRLSIEDPATSAQHNVLGFANVLDCARHAKLERVVYASSASVYGDPVELPLTEESTPIPLSPYGLDKLVNEQQAALFGRLFGLSTVGLRYFNAYGPRQDPASPYAGVISRFAARIRANEPLPVFGDGKQTRDFIFVKDIARVNVAALQSSEIGICAVGTGHSVTLLELIDELGRCIGQRPQVRHDEPMVGDIRHSAVMPRRMKEWFGGIAPVELKVGLPSLFGD
jgi:UDP-glucose 4-epimerase